jgi:hypothetical protein
VVSRELGRDGTGFRFLPPFFRSDMNDHQESTANYSTPFGSLTESPLLDITDGEYWYKEVRGSTKNWKCGVATTHSAFSTTMYDV